MKLNKKQQQALLVFLATNHSVRDASEWVLSELDDIELTLRDNLLDDSDDVDDDDNVNVDELESSLEVDTENLPVKERAILIHEDDSIEDVVVELSSLDDPFGQSLLLNVYKPSANKKKRQCLIENEVIYRVVVDDFGEDETWENVVDPCESYKMSLILGTGELVTIAVKYESQLDVILGSDTPLGVAVPVTLK